MLFKVESVILKQSLVFLSLVGPTLVGAQCDAGWVGTTDVGCYKFLTDQASTSQTWFQAKTLCEAQGGYLAELKTESANSFVSTLAASAYPAVTGGWHIGLSDIVVEGTWQWFSTQETVSYTAWEANKPDTSDGNTNDCAYLTVSAQFVGTWTDADDCLTALADSAIICEKASTSLTTDSSATTATTTSSTTTCSSGWYSYGGSCYKFVLANGVLGSTWSDAETYCSTAGGHLTSVHSLEEENFIEAMVTNYDGRELSYWMGAKPSILGSWEWSDGSAWDYTNFNNDDETATVGRCLIQFGGYYGDAKGWSTYPCSSTAYFVCKI